MNEPTRRDIVAGTAAAAAGHVGASAASVGPFQPNWNSLTSRYRAPDWFRDAKFGIWAHWSAQCVPEAGDWYARRMYVQGDSAYEHHLHHYGHPTETGFMQIENLWKAEHWDPDALIGSYKRAGAKYFVALASHHDNLDNWASRHHAWNTMRVGPRRDLIGAWRQSARNAGLRFGVSNHAAHAWHWWQTAYGYDPEGPLKGVRYDAARLTKADGRGLWWDGLDPQELYTGPSIVMPPGIDTIKRAQDWHDAHDGDWCETTPPTPLTFARNWRDRCLDLIDQHAPDLLYFDDWEPPFGELGLDVVAHLYNQSVARTGRIDAVVTAKKLQGDHARGLVEDYERGFSDQIRAGPWQTDTCIGDWHYDRAIYERQGYKGARQVVRMLSDIVSKNGNLLLSIPVRPDGTIDADEHAIVESIAAWMAVHGEAIHGTRPWRVFGEGPTRPKAGMFVEDDLPYGPQDIRFTKKAGDLFAILMGRPAEGDVLIRALAAGSAGRVERVQLLGGGELAFERRSQGLSVTLPSGAEGSVAALAISGSGLTG